MGKLAKCCRCSCGCFGTLLVVLAAMLLDFTKMNFKWAFECVLEKEIPLQSLEDESLNIVHIAYVFNSKGSFGVLGSMVSVAKHLKAPADCIFHLIVSEAMMEEASSIQRCFENEFSGRPRPNVTLHKLLPLDIDISKNIEPGAVRSYLNQTEMWTLLYLADYFPDLQRVMWLEIDIVAMSDLAPLYRVDLKNTTLAATDEMVRIIKGPLLNAGVMVLDLNKMRAKDVREQIKEVFARLSKERGVTCNQEVLSVVFPTWTEIDWRWNAQGVTALFEGYHFSLSASPPRLEFPDFIHHVMSRIFRRYCWDSLRVMHMSNGDNKHKKKWWYRTGKELAYCPLLAEHVHQHECLGHRLRC